MVEYMASYHLNKLQIKMQRTEIHIKGTQMCQETDLAH